MLRQLRKILVSVCLSVLLLLGMGIMVAPSAGAVDYNKRSLLNEDFSNQDLRGDSFDLASLRGSDFSHADLRGVRFFSANLEYVNFEGADLRGAVLDSARLDHTNFTNANLEGAFLASVKVKPSTIIEGADFTDALILPQDEGRLCAIASGTNPTTGRNTIDTLYCP